MAYSKLSDSAGTLHMNQDEIKSMTSGEIVYMVTGAIRTMVTSTAQVFADFQSSMKEISPMLSKEEQNEVHGAFGEFHKLLMMSQTFVTKTTIRVRRAKTNDALLASIDINTLRTLCSQTQVLLQRFWPISTIIEDKLKEHKTFTMWRNIALGVLGISTGVLIVATGVGVHALFTPVVKGILTIGGSVAVGSVTAAIVAQAAQNLTVFQQVIDSLKKIEHVLVNLSENYAKQEGYAEDLSIEDSTKKEFLDLLQEAEKEVKKGFEILKKI
jgi:hypothetical protein